MLVTLHSFIKNLPELLNNSSCDQATECLEEMFHYTLNKVVPVKLKIISVKK